VIVTTDERRMLRATGQKPAYINSLSSSENFVSKRQELIFQYVN